MSDKEKKKEEKEPSKDDKDKSGSEEVKENKNKEESEKNRQNDTISQSEKNKQKQDEKNQEQVVNNQKTELEKNGNVVQVITVPDNQEEENIKQTNDVIKDILAEEQKKENSAIVEQRHDRKFSKKTMIRKVPFSFKNVDEYFHLKYHHVNVILRLLIECFIVSILFLILPIISVLISSGGNKDVAFIDHIMKKKTPDDLSSIFLRTCVFFTMGYFVYVFMDLFTSNILYFIALFFTTFGFSIHGVVAEYLQVIRASRKHLKNAIVAFVMFNVGTILIYEYTFLSQDKSFSSLFLTAIIWTSIFSFILFLESFLMNLLTSELRRKSFKDRIWDINYKTFIIKKLVAIAEAMPFGRHRVNEIIHNLINDYDTGFFLRHNDLDINTPESVNTISEGVFGYLEIDELPYKSIKKYFPDNYDEVYGYLIDNKVTKDTESFPSLEFEVFKARCTEVYQERIDISRSLYDRDNILRKLDYILTSIVVFFSFIILLILLSVDYKIYLASIGPMTFTFSWIFQDSIKEIYSCFVFLLVNHPFDCGDRIKIDNEEFLVLRIDLLYTTCTTVNGKIKYLPNAALFLKYIENIRRSDTQSEDISVNVESGTTFVQMLKVRDGMTQFAKRNDKDFTGSIYIKNYEPSGNNINIIFTIEHTSNFQDMKPRLMRRDSFVKELESTLDRERIKYAKSYVAKD